MFFKNVIQNYIFKNEFFEVHIEALTALLSKRVDSFSEWK